MFETDTCSVYLKVYAGKSIWKANLSGTAEVKLYIETNEMTSTCTGSVMHKLHIFRDQLASYTLLC